MKRIISILLCAALAVSLACPVLAAGITAVRSNQAVYVDGKRVELEAYSIDGANYVKLRDVGKVLNVNVYWDGSAVQIDTASPYTGLPPASTKLAAPSASAAQNVDVLRQEFVDRTNAVRLAHGQDALPTDPMLMRAAQVRAEEMAATTTYSHTRPDGTSCRTAVDCPYISENINRIWDSTLEKHGVSLAEYCVDSWAKSAGHLQIMTQGEQCAMGVGLARGLNSFGEPCWYCVEWFMWNGYTITWVDTPKIP